MVNLKWLGELAFEANPPTGNKFVMDAHPESGGHNRGPTPVEALLGSMAACSAMDVISVLEKKRQKVRSYRLEIDGDRTPPGSDYPRPFTAIRLKHILEGENLDPAAVARAIQLSEDKYCTVLQTIKYSPPVTSTFEINGSEQHVISEQIERVRNQGH
jgi:putative redox protein